MLADKVEIPTHTICMFQIPSSMVLYQVLINSYGHICITKVCGGVWLAGVVLYRGFLVYHQSLVDGGWQEWHNMEGFQC